MLLCKNTLKWAVVCGELAGKAQHASHRLLNPKPGLCFFSKCRGVSTRSARSEGEKKKKKRLQPTKWTWVALHSVLLLHLREAYTWRSRLSPRGSDPSSGHRGETRQPSTLIASIVLGWKCAAGRARALEKNVSATDGLTDPSSPARGALRTREETFWHKKKKGGPPSLLPSSLRVGPCIAWKVSGDSASTRSARGRGTKRPLERLRSESSLRLVRSSSRVCAVPLTLRVVYWTRSPLLPRGTSWRRGKLPRVFFFYCVCLLDPEFSDERIHQLVYSISLK